MQSDLQTLIGALDQHKANIFEQTIAAISSNSDV